MIKKDYKYVLCSVVSASYVAESIMTDIVSVYVTTVCLFTADKTAARNVYFSMRIRETALFLLPV